MKPRSSSVPAGKDGQTAAFKRFLPKIRAYLGNHPDGTFEDVKRTLGLTGLSKPWFLVIRGEVLGKNAGGTKKVTTPTPARSSGHMVVEILETIDSSMLSTEVKDHYRTPISSR